MDLITGDQFKPASLGIRLNIANDRHLFSSKNWANLWIVTKGFVSEVIALADIGREEAL